MIKPAYTKDMLMKRELVTLAQTVLDNDEPPGERLKCAEALFARLPELNGGNWLLIGQKKGFSEDDTRLIKRAMDHHTELSEVLRRPSELMRP